MLQETASVIESIIAEFKGPAGLDIDGIHLFKSTEAVDSYWATASKHLGCMQVSSFIFLVLIMCHVSRPPKLTWQYFKWTPESSQKLCNVLCFTGSPWYSAVRGCEDCGAEWRAAEQVQVPARQQLSGGIARTSVQCHSVTEMWHHAIPSE